MSEQNKFEKLKVGDSVFYESDSPIEKSCILKITKITKTLIICENKKFKKIDGLKTPGKYFSYPKIKILTREMKVNIKKNQLCKRLRSYNFKLKTLIEIDKILKKEEFGGEKQ